MSDHRPQPVTQLLAAAAQGDATARDRLWGLVYEELRAVALHQLADEAVSHRRQPTSLVHEAYLRLTAGDQVEWKNRRHFFAVAAQAMRRIRIDDARKRRRHKRGGGERPAALGEDRDGNVRDVPQDEGLEIAEALAVDEALTRLEAKDPRKAEIVMLRCFGGFTVEECADALGLSPRTVRSEWRFARAWLHAALSETGPESKRAE